MIPDDLTPLDLMRARWLVARGHLSEDQLLTSLHSVPIVDLYDQGGLVPYLIARKAIPAAVLEDLPTQVAGMTDGTQVAITPPPATGASGTIADSSFGAEEGRVRRPAVAGLVTPRFDDTVATGAGAVARPHLKRIGRFEVDGILGKGGMGVVYKAHDPDMKRTVALKVLSVADREDQEMIARFFREAQTAGSLRHPGIVAIHEVGTFEDAPYVAMEFIDGEPLWSRIAEATPDSWPLRERVQLFHEVARAVQHAHEHRIVHRDLKPANIMLDRSGRPCVLDFGLARRIDGGTRVTVTGAFLGTPGYMPPEQIAGETAKIGPATDVFALGVILYELLVGRAPFKGSGQAEVIANTIGGAFAPPRKANPRVHPDLETICARCLEPEPERRFPHAGALADDVGRFLAGEPILARPASRGRRAWTWVKRHRGLALAGGILLATVGAGAGIAWRDAAARAVAVAAEGQRWKAAYLALEKGRAATERGLKAQRRGDTKPLYAAVAVLEDAAAEALRINPGMPEAHYELGRTYRWLGEIEKSDAALGRAIEAAPDHALARYERAMLRLSLYRDALANAEWALRAALADQTGGSFVDARDLAHSPKRAELETVAPTLVTLRAGILEDLHHVASLAGHEEKALVARAVLAYEESGGLRRKEAEALLHDALAVDDVLDEAWLALAYDATQAGEWTAAEDCLGNLIERDRGSWTAWSRRGSARRQRAQGEADAGRDPVPLLEGALADARTAVKLAPRDFTGQVELGHTCHDLGRQQRRRGQDSRTLLREGIAALEAASQLAPERTWARDGICLMWVEVGEVARNLGQDPREAFGDAVKEGEKGVHLDEKRVEPRNHLARALLATAQFELSWGRDAQGLTKRALDVLEPVLREAKRNLNTLRTRVEALLQLASFIEIAKGDPRETYRNSIAAADASLEVDPTSPLVLNNKGIALARLAEQEELRGGSAENFYRDALAVFDASLKVEPAARPTRNARAHTLVELGRIERAAGKDGDARFQEVIQAFAGTVPRDMQSMEGCLWLADAYRELGDSLEARGMDPGEAWHKAHATLSAILEKEPNVAPARASRGPIAMRLGKYEATHGGDPRARFQAAEQDLTSMIRSGFEKCRIDLATLYEAMGRFSEALDELESAAGANPGLAAAAGRARERVQASLRKAPSDTCGESLLAAAAASVAASAYGDALPLYEKAFPRIEAELAALDPARRERRRKRMQESLAEGHFLMACALAQLTTGKVDTEEGQRLRDAAFEHLKKSREAGGCTREGMQAEHALEPLHADPRWAALAGG